MYKFVETKNALKDWEKLQSMSKTVKDKYKYFVVDILEQPRNPNTVGNPEQLKHTETEMWSRELTKKDRIVYGIEPGYHYNMPEENEIVVFYQYLGHYQDK
jgi:Txe/YoeB family toxin of Txe-Axe toxin-antitoxin module